MMMMPITMMSNHIAEKYVQLPPPTAAAEGAVHACSTSNSSFNGVLDAYSDAVNKRMYGKLAAAATSAVALKAESTVNCMLL